MKRLLAWIRHIFKRFFAWINKIIDFLKPRIKEWFRKKMVSLKRRPFYIPFTMIIISCLVLNLNLTAFSDTTAQINEPGMGLTLFVVTLCSFLMVIGFGTAFPNRKKPKIVSIILICLMILISIAGEVRFLQFIRYGTELRQNPIVITPQKAYILEAKYTAIAHIVCNVLSILLIVTMPIYSKKLKEINTKPKLYEDEFYIEKIDLAEDEKF